MAFIVPWSFWPLDDNIKFQFASFGGVLLMMGIFSYQFFFKATWHGDSVPVFGKSYEQLIGVFITSWAFVMVVPSWVNEKKDHVSINKTIWSACITGMLVCTILRDRIGLYEYILNFFRLILDLDYNVLFPIVIYNLTIFYEECLKMEIF
jgi:amino acid permease